MMGDRRREETGWNWMWRVKGTTGFGMRRERKCPVGQENELKNVAVAIAGRGNIWKVSETVGVRGHQDSLEIILAEMSNSGEMESEETICTKFMWFLFEVGGTHSTSKSLSQNFSCLENAGTIILQRKWKDYTVSCLTSHPSHELIQNPDTINEAILHVQTGN